MARTRDCPNTNARKTKTGSLQRPWRDEGDRVVAGIMAPPWWMALPGMPGNAAASIQPVRIYRAGEIIPCAPIHQAQGLAEGVPVLVGTAAGDAFDFMCVERFHG